MATKDGFMNIDLDDAVASFDEESATITINGKEVSYKDMAIEDIIAWCKENNEVEWLKETVAKKVPCKVHPRVKVAKLDANGNPVLNKKGKPMMKSVSNKDAKPVVEMRPISFIQIKIAFVEKFMPSLKPVKKPKKASMYDVISAL